MRQVCPWCDTEIIWDEETGVEDLCPHCMNAVNEYRTLGVTLEESGESEEKLGGATEAAALPRNWDVFDRQVEHFSEGQQEKVECPHCREPMIETGQMEVDRARFLPRMPENGGAPLLSPPFTISWHLCPYCFEMRSKLSAEDQHKVNAVLDDMKAR